MLLLIEGPSGEQYETDVPADMTLGVLAADFFEDRNWPTSGAGGRARAVVELVNPQDPDDTKRQNSQQTVEQAGLRDGDTLRIFPEAMAGVVDQRDRLRALITDHNQLLDLCERNELVTFKANRSEAPDRYVVTLRYPGFKEFPPGAVEPERTTDHQVEVVLPADYPREAPQLRWLTPIFHPNIKMPEGGICLGELFDRYMPGMGLARLVTMLADLIQYRNFNPLHGVNQTAVEWVRKPDSWEVIARLGGYPFQGPLEELLHKFQRGQRPRVVFKSVKPV